MRKYGPLNSGEVGTLCVDTDTDADSNKPIIGTIVSVGLEFDISCASAPTVTITTNTTPAITILAATTDVDGWYQPVQPVHDPLTGLAISDVYTNGIAIHDFVNVALTNAEEGDSVDVWLMIAE